MAIDRYCGICLFIRSTCPAEKIEEVRKSYCLGCVYDNYIACAYESAYPKSTVYGPIDLTFEEVLSDVRQEGEGDQVSEEGE